MNWRDRRKRDRQQEEQTWPHPGGGERLFRDEQGDDRPADWEMEMLEERAAADRINDAREDEGDG